MMRMNLAVVALAATCLLMAVQPAAAQATGQEFSTFLNDRGSVYAKLTAEQRESMFREFLQWQKQRTGAQR